MSQVLNSGYAKSKLGFNGTRNLTWAQRPNAAQYQNEIIYISDIGIGGSYWTSNGTYWSPLNGEVTLAQSGAAIDMTGASTEQVMATYTLPGGLMTPWSQLEIIVLWSFTNSANTKILRVRQSSVGGGTYDPYFYFAGTTTASVQNICVIRSNNSISAQKGFGIGTGGVSGLGALSASLSAFNRNLANASDIVLTGQLTNSSETITVEAYSIVYRG